VDAEACDWRGLKTAATYCRLKDTEFPGW